MIRKAALPDVPNVVDFGERFHAHSQQPFPYDREAAERFSSQMISNPNGAVFLSKSGMIGGVLTPAYCAPNWIMAVELFWWAESGGLKLLDAFEDWAVQSGASEIRMTSLTALKRADKLLKNLSYTPAEISYRKVV